MNHPHIAARLNLIAKTRLNTLSCIFCRRTPTTHEHIFSEWTHEPMGPRETRNAKMFVSIQHVERTDFLDDLRLPGPLRDWQIKCVCEKRCNNGWMREIENAAIPIMTPLIKGEPKTLSPHDQKVIATWAVLKAMVAHHPFISERKRKLFAAKKEPQADWFVWIANYPRQDGGPAWDSRPFALGRQTGRSATPNCHASTQTLHRLFVHVVNCIDHEFIHRWTFTRPGGGSPIVGNIVPIWPPTNISVTWPPPHSLTDLDAKVVSGALVNAVKRLISEWQASRRT